jgi:PAS domain S-box-containing protein
VADLTDGDTGTDGPTVGADELLVLQAQLVDAVDEAVMATDLDGRITYWNRFAEQLYGWTAAEVLGRPVQDVTPSSATADQAREIMDALGRGESWTGEFEVRRKDGTTFLAHVTDSPIVVGGRQVGMVGVSFDVSEQRSLEDAVRSSARFTRRVLDELAAFVGVLDLEGRVLEANRAPLEAGGLTLDDVVGRPFWECAWWTWSDETSAAVREAVVAARHGETRRFDVQVRLFDGSLAWIDFQVSPLRDETGRVTHLIPSAIDVQERRLATAALRESEERFRTLADELPVMVWLHDAERHLEYVNRTYVEYFGVRREDMIADRWQALVHPDDAPRYAAGFEEAVRGRRLFHAEVRVRDDHGEWRWLESWARPRFGPDGTYLGHLGTSADITDRKRTEAELEQRRRAEQRARHEAELLAEILGELEAAPSVRDGARRLARLLVPTVADEARIELPGEPAPVTAGDPHHSDVAPPPGLRLPMPIGPGDPAMVTLARVRPARASFDAEDRRFLLDVLGRAGLVLGSARLRQEQHEISTRLQRALLPERVVAAPEVRLAARYESGSSQLEVGGDWYDTAVLPDGRIALSVGDVVGHGLDAAASMGRLRNALAALAPRLDGPAQVLTQLDEFARGPNGTGFATACYATFDPGSGELRYASAGHPPLLVVSPDGTTRWIDDGRSPPLAALRVDHRPEGATPLHPGDAVLCFSDGLIERRGTVLQEGLDLVEAVARHHADADPDVLCDRVVEASLARRPTEDDVVVVCLRWAPTPADRFRRTIPARPEELGPLRSELRRWLDARGVPADRHLDPLLAVGEALANSVEHAYAGTAGDGTVHVELALEHDDLVVTVRDEGVWRPPTPSNGRRGRGTAIMRSVSRGFSRHTDDRGTTVTCRIPVAEGT